MKVLYVFKFAEDNNGFGEEMYFADKLKRVWKVHYNIEEDENIANCDNCNFEELQNDTTYRLVHNDKTVYLKEDRSGKSERIIQNEMLRLEQLRRARSSSNDSK